MLRLSGSTRIFVATSTAHYHKGVDGLVQAVRCECGEDPLDGHLFCFFNRRRSSVKVLVWDRNGFWILHKRLERGSFEVIDLSPPWVEIDRVRLAMLLEGLDTRTARFRRNFVREVHISNRDEGDVRGRLAE